MSSFLKFPEVILVQKVIINNQARKANKLNSALDGREWKPHRLKP